MAHAPTDSSQARLLEAARSGDEVAFGRLVEPYRGELHAHCYRMLASQHDADDAFQDAMLRAWRALDRLQDEKALRAWLYRIATNASLDAIGRRPKRVLPIDYGAAADGDEMPGRPVTESVWLEPYPDEILEIEDGYASPDASYEQREGMELAFIAALQHLPPNQRAALILREVLGFSAKEVAEALDTSVASVNSALQRARETVDTKLPEQSQQANLATLADEDLAQVVEGYMSAMAAGDVEAVLGLLTEDASWTMPPLSTWYAGREAGIRPFLHNGPLSGLHRWKHVATGANGQPAIGSYTWDEDAGAYMPFALDVLSLEGTRIKRIDSFIVRSIDVPDDYDFQRYPDQPANPLSLEGVFRGLPPRLG